MDRVIGIAFLFFTLGCVPIDGGAVEANWVVVTYDGRTISNCGCTCPPIDKIRLKLIPFDGSIDICAGRASCQFACGANSGATRFDIPPGSYTISLVPVGMDGNDIVTGEADMCSARAGADPFVRDVVGGQVTQLDAIMILASCAAECGGADNNKVCTK